jgi:hypothetical protein
MSIALYKTDINSVEIAVGGILDVLEGFEEHDGIVVLTAAICEWAKNHNMSIARALALSLGLNMAKDYRRSGYVSPEELKREKQKEEAQQLREFQDWKDKQRLKKHGKTHNRNSQQTTD